MHVDSWHSCRHAVAPRYAVEVRTQACTTMAPMEAWNFHAGLAALLMQGFDEPPEKPPGHPTAIGYAQQLVASQTSCRMPCLPTGRDMPAGSASASG